MKTTTTRTNSNPSTTYLYKDNRFAITRADVRTRTAYYPILDTVGRIRRDISFTALGFAGLVGFALWRYYDLWYARERLIMSAIIATALIISSQVSLLQLDARGFPSRIFIARASTVRKIFAAITQARANAAQSTGGFEPEEAGYGDE